MKKINKIRGLLSSTISDYSTAARARLISNKQPTSKRKVSQINLGASMKIETSSSSKDLTKRKGKLKAKTGFQTERKSQAKLYSQQKPAKKLKKKSINLNKSQTPKFEEITKMSVKSPSPKAKLETQEGGDFIEKKNSEEKASPDFKINLSNQSRIDVKDSVNKSIKIEGSVGADEKLSEIIEKDSNFIEIGDNEINPHDSFSRNPAILISKFWTIKFYLASNDVVNNQPSTIQLKLDEKSQENQRLVNQNGYLQQQVNKYEEMLSKMNGEYEKLLNDVTFKVNSMKNSIHNLF